MAAAILTTAGLTSNYMGTGPAPVAGVVPPVTPPASVFNTGIPFIGSVNLSNPTDLLFLGAAAGSAVMLKGSARVIVPLAILAARYFMGQAVAQTNVLQSTIAQ